MDFNKIKPNSIVICGPAVGGFLAVYRFANGYGAVAFQDNGELSSRTGLFRMGVAQWASKTDQDRLFRLVHHESVDGSIWLTESEVLDALGRIEAFPTGVLYT